MFICTIRADCPRISTISPVTGYDSDTYGFLSNWDSPNTIRLRRQYPGKYGPEIP